MTSKHIDKLKDSHGNYASEKMPLNDSDSGSAHNDSDKPSIKKRKYSRGGCMECKRRKMKCDEGKPFCFNCTRLKKECIYQHKQKFRFENVNGDDEKANETDKHLTPMNIHSNPSDISTNESPPTNVQSIQTNPMFLQNAKHISLRYHNPIHNDSKVLAQNESNVRLQSKGSTSPNVPFPLLAYPTTQNMPMPQISYDKSIHVPFPEKHQSPYAEKSPYSDKSPYSEKSSYSEKTATIPYIEKPMFDKTILSYDEKSPLQQTNHEKSMHLDKKTTFKNAISDILTPTNPSPELTDPSLVNYDVNDVRNLFDEASLLVHDINDLLSLDISEQMIGMAPEKKSHSNHISSDIHSHQIYPESLSHQISSETRPSPYNLQTIQPHTGSTGSVTSECSTRLAGSETFENHNFRLEDLTSNITGTIEMPRPRDIPGTDVDVLVSNTDLINEVILRNNLSGPHVKYLSVLTTTDLSYHLYPFASSIESNEVVKLLLNYLVSCPYLLTSLLAISATFQYNQSGNKVHESSRNKYISLCIRLLSDAFAKTNSDDKRFGNILVSHIEKLVLTVLVLTSNFSATSDSSKDILSLWKTHLRGAKDLLINYESITSSETASFMSGGLALAKTWFFAMEALAGLCCSLGGTLMKKTKDRQNDTMSSTETDEELEDSNDRLFSDTGYFNKESNLEYHNALVRTRLMTSPRNTALTEFNLFTGFTVTNVKLMEEFTKALYIIRANSDIQISSTRIAKVMALIHEGRNVEIAPGVSKSTFIILKNTPAHPDFPINHKDKVVLPQSGYSKYVDIHGNVTYYSWFDYSEQVRINIMYIRLLCCKGLMHIPRKHRLVKELLRNTLDTAFFIRAKNSENYEKDKYNILAETANYYITNETFDNRTFMIQSSFRIAFTMAQDMLDFEKIEIFFLGLVKLGNGSSLSALDTLYRYRDIAMKNGGYEYDDDYEDEFPQKDILPFA